jgi:excisionase family DNA binding protein
VDNASNLKSALEEKIKHLDNLMSEIESDKVVLKEIMTLKELCRYLKLSESKVNALIEDSSIPHYKNSQSNRVYFYKQDIDIWKKKNKK